MQEVFKDPVVAADGYTYERQAIEDWLQKSNTSPMTNERMTDKELVMNNIIKTILQEFA